MRSFLFVSYISLTASTLSKNTSLIITKILDLVILAVFYLTITATDLILKGIKQLPQE